MEDSSRTLLAVVGDAHDDWGPQDHAAIKFLCPDMTCFVGDFSDDKLVPVRMVSRLSHNKAVILGNHDTGLFTFRKAFSSRIGELPAPNTSPLQDEDRLSQVTSLEDLATVLPDGRKSFIIQQLRMLGRHHVAYTSIQVPGKKVAIVGSRPFADSSPDWRSCDKLIGVMYPGIASHEDSAQRSVDIALDEANKGNTVVLMGHNAPSGLGDRLGDIAASDWSSTCTDVGAPDLRLAVDKLHAAGVHVPLVLCGHMHHELWGGKGLRRMVHVMQDTGSIVLNAATVPRVRPCPDNGWLGRPKGTLRHFLLVQLADGQVEYAKEVWVHVQGWWFGWHCQIAEEKDIVTTKYCSDGSRQVTWWDANRCVYQETTLGTARQRI